MVRKREWWLTSPISLRSSHVGQETSNHQHPFDFDFPFNSNPTLLSISAVPSFIDSASNFKPNKSETDFGLIGESDSAAPLNVWSRDCVAVREDAADWDRHCNLDWVCGRRGTGGLTNPADFRLLPGAEPPLLTGTRDAKFGVGLDGKAPGVWGGVLPTELGIPE